MSTVEEIDEMNESFANLLFGRYGEDNDDEDITHEENEVRLFMCPRHGPACARTLVDEGLPCSDAIDETMRWCVELKQARDATPPHRARRIQSLNLRLQMVILLATMLGFGEMIDAASTDLKEMSEAISILQWNIACSVALIILVLSLRHVMLTFSDCLRRLSVAVEGAFATWVGLSHALSTGFLNVLGTVDRLLPDIMVQVREHLRWQRLIGLATVGVGAVGVLVQLVRLPMDWFGRKTGVHLFEQQSRFNRKFYNGAGAFMQTVAATFMFLLVPFLGVAKALKWFDPLIKLLDKVPYATWLIDWFTRWMKGKATFDEAQEMVRDVVGEKPSEIFVDREKTFPTSSQQALWSAVKKHDHLECNDKCSSCVCKCHTADKTEDLKEMMHERSTTGKMKETAGLGSGDALSKFRESLHDAMHDHNSGTALSRLERTMIQTRTCKKLSTSYRGIPPGKVGKRTVGVIKNGVECKQDVEVYENCRFLRDHKGGCSGECLQVLVQNDTEDVFLSEDEVAKIRVEAILEADRRGILTPEEAEKYAHIIEKKKHDAAAAEMKDKPLVQFVKQSFADGAIKYKRGEIDEVELATYCEDENDKIMMSHLMYAMKHGEESPLQGRVTLKKKEIPAPPEPFERLEIEEEEKVEKKEEKQEAPEAPLPGKWERRTRRWLAALGQTAQKICPSVVAHVKEHKKKYMTGAAAILIGAAALAAAYAREDDGDKFVSEAKGKSKRGRYVFRKRVDVRRATKRQDHVESSGAEQDLETPDVSDNDEREYVRREKNLRAEDSYEEESVKKPEPPVVEEPHVTARRSRAVRNAKNRIMFATQRELKDFNNKKAVLIKPESTFGKMIIDPEIERSIKSKVFKFKYDDEFTSSATLVSGKLCVPLHAHDAEAEPSATNFLANVKFNKDDIVPIAEDLGYFDTRGTVPKTKGWHMRETASGGEMVLAVYFKDPEAQEPSMSVGFAAPGGLHDAPTVKGACGGAIVAASDGALLGWPIGGGEKVNKYIPVTKEVAEVLLGQRKPQLQVFQ